MLLNRGELHITLAMFGCTEKDGMSLSSSNYPSSLGSVLALAAVMQVLSCEAQPTLCFLVLEPPNVGASTMDQIGVLYVCVLSY